MYLRGVVGNGLGASEALMHDDDDDDDDSWLWYTPET